MHALVSIYFLLGNNFIVHLLISVRDRPFNLQRGGVCFFCVQDFFFGQDESQNIYFFLSRKARNFCPEFDNRLYVKNSDYFFSSNKIRIFFSAIVGIRIFFLGKNHNPPPFQVKCSFPKAFDTVWRTGLWKKMLKHDINGKCF